MNTEMRTKIEEDKVMKFEEMMILTSKYLPRGLSMFALDKMADLLCSYLDAADTGPASISMFRVATKFAAAVIYVGVVNNLLNQHENNVANNIAEARASRHANNKNAYFSQNPTNGGTNGVNDTRPGVAN